MDVGGGGWDYLEIHLWFAFRLQFKPYFKTNAKLKQTGVLQELLLKK